MSQFRWQRSHHTSHDNSWTVCHCLCYKTWVRSDANNQLTVMEIKFEMCDHNLDDLLCVFRESFLQFSRITDQHLTGGRLLLQTRRPNSETLLERRRKCSEISQTGHQLNATCSISTVFNRWQIIQQGTS